MAMALASTEISAVRMYARMIVSHWHHGQHRLKALGAGASAWPCCPGQIRGKLTPPLVFIMPHA
jgi:hypothetical protein